MILQPNIKMLNDRQTRYLEKVRNFSKGYTNIGSNRFRLNKILANEWYGDNDRDFILRMIDWYLREQKKLIKN